jgi:hypothetical protein
MTMWGVGRAVARVALAAMILSAVACERDAPPLTDEATGPGDLEPSAMTCDVPAAPRGVATVQVVFTCDEQPVGTWRRIEDPAADTLQLALHELLRGPTVDERESGLTSFFSAETAGMLNRVELRDGVAYIDFRDFSSIIPNASASAGSALLLDQIAGTVFQFDGIDEAEVSFDGSCDRFWNWLQRGCQRLTRHGE